MKPSSHIYEIFKEQAQSAPFNVDMNRIWIESIMQYLDEQEENK